MLKNKKVRRFGYLLPYRPLTALLAIPVSIILFWPAGFAGAQPQLGWVPFDEVSPAEKPSQSYMKDETTTGMLVNFDITGMFVYEVEAEGETYQRLTIPGRGTTTEIGKPEVPIVGEILEVPYGVDFEIEIVKSEYKTLQGYNVYPYQKPKPFTNGTGSEDFILDRNAYRIDAYYPKEISEITTEDIAVIRGHRIVLLKANPVQYNPVSKELKVFSNLEIRVKYNQPAQIRKIDKRLISMPFEEILEKSILNYKDLSRFDWRNYDYYDEPQGKYSGVIIWPGTWPGPIDFDTDYSPENDAGGLGNNSNEWYGDNTGCDYLILTTGVFYNPTDANSPVVKLRDWKRRKGLVTKVVLLADVPDNDTDGDVDASDIEDYIQDIYDKWSPPPTYILLFGDTGDNGGNEILPTCYETQHPFDTSAYGYSKAEIGTDLHYVTTDGNDFFPDIFIGRISVDDAVEGNAVVDKIIDYEHTPPNNANFYQDLSLVCLFEDDDPEDGREDNGFPIIETAEPVRNYLLNNGYNPERIYATSAATTNPQTYVNGGAVPAGIQWTGGTADITNAINTGRFFVSYLGHGNRRSWNRPGFTTVNVDNLGNGGLSPIVFSFACETGWFDNETDDDTTLGIHNADTNNNSECLCEHFLRDANGGAVAVIGSSRVSYSENIELMTGTIEAIWPDFGPVSESGPLLRLGQVNTFSKVYMANNYTGASYRKIHFEMYNLFGDPEMPIWTRNPTALTVNHPAGIGSTGEQDFVVRVEDNGGSPVNNAVVCLTKDGDIVSARYTNGLGVARFTRSFSAGTLDITVSALNFRPYTGEINVTAGGAVVNRLNPDNGTEGQPFNIGGKNFSTNDSVDIYLGDLQMTDPLQPHQAPSGQFGQPGVEDFSLTVPTPHEHGLFNVIAEGRTSGRYAVDVFQVRDPKPVDLYTYSQWDNSTWGLHTGDNPTWDNPEIQIYDVATNNPVASDNLIAGRDYRIVAKIHNKSNFVARNATITFKSALHGSGQTVWDVIDPPVTVTEVPANGTANAEKLWRPFPTGHICVKVFIDHVEDIYNSNNTGQENCTVKPTSSPGTVSFKVWNPTEYPGATYFEVRQLYLNVPGKKGPIWETWVKHPEPQVLEPGAEGNAEVIIDPDWTYIEPEKKTEFAITGFVNGEMVGGVNVITYRKLRRWLASIHAGYSKPFRTFADHYDLGFSIFGDVGYNITPRLSVIGLFGYNWFKAGDNVPATISNTYWFNVNGNVQYRLPIRNRVSTYFRGGSGYYFPESGDRKLGTNTGAGVYYHVNNLITLGFGMDYHIIFNGMGVYELTPPLENDDIHFALFHGGLILNF